MQKQDNLTREPGVYLLVNEARKVAYIGKCGNIRHRAAVWDYNFRKLAEDPEHRMPVRDWPKNTNEEDWQFCGWTQLDAEIMRNALIEQGYTLLNDKVRSREMLDYNGRTMSLAEHCKAEGVNYTRAYYRLRAGKPLEKVFEK